MKFYNTSLETMDVMCDSKVFKFYPRQYTEVPVELAGFLYEQVKSWGCFPIKDGMTDAEIKEAKYKALKDYLKGALRIRIDNYGMQKDMYQKLGVTLQPDAAEKRALRWKTEIHKLLELESPLEEELSFIGAEDRKLLGIDVPNIQDVEDKLANIPQNVFDVKTIKDAEVKKVGRPKKIDSFDDVKDLGV